jgi:hypothetical protein
MEADGCVGVLRGECRRCVRRGHRRTWSDVARGEHRRRRSRSPVVPRSNGRLGRAPSPSLLRQ